MTSRLASAIALCAVLTASGVARAQDGGAPDGGTPAAPDAGPSLLGAYLDALAARRLITPESGSVERMREAVATAEELYLDEHYNEASLLFFEVCESPRFADFVDEPEFRGAEYNLAGSLEKLGALRTAQRYLDRILARGIDDPYFGPAYRRSVDVALESGEIDDAVAHLAALPIDPLPDDAQNELRYLRGRAGYDAGRLDEAEQDLAQVTRHSRFYAGAQYLRGAIAAKQGNLHDAEQRFCSVSDVPDNENSTFLVDWRYFEVKDMARMGLGRVAHEGHRADDAFYYYFQVPSDSSHTAEAMFEAAYAMYEGGDYDTSIDLLDQLQTRFPESAFSDEASMLRGYLYLGRCEFEKAQQELVRFENRFRPVVDELSDILQNSARQDSLYQELLDEEQREAAAHEHDTAASTPTPESGNGDHGEHLLPTGQPAAQGAQPPQEDPRATLLALLRVDPTFYRLHAQVRTLDAESARASRVAIELGALRARAQGTDAPRAAIRDDDSGPTDFDEARREIADARANVAALGDQLDAMRRANAPRADVQSIEADLRRIATRVDGMERSLRQAERQAGATAEPTDTPAGTDLVALLRNDEAHARLLPGRVAAVRGQLLDAANVAALRAVHVLHERLAREVRRARIGRIDAVMGSKRRIEIQIESLSAGRFPPELVDPLRIQGLLRDDEEFWPFEGELWTDEYEDNEASRETDE